jgi:hypothetical protein
MADETARPQTISEDNSADTEQDDPKDLVVQTSAKASEQRASRVQRRTDVRMEDWQEAERLIMEDMKKVKKPAT